jgi:hypothetical protein
MPDPVTLVGRAASWTQIHQWLAIADACQKTVCVGMYAEFCTEKPLINV